MVTNVNKYWNRKMRLDVTDTEVASASSLPESPSLESGANHFISQSVVLRQTSQVKDSSPTPNSLRRVRSETVCGRLGSILGFTSPDGNGGLSTPQSILDAEGNSDRAYGLSRGSPQSSVLLSGISCRMNDKENLHTGTKVNGNGLESSSMPLAKENFRLSPPPGDLVCAKLSCII